MALARHRFRHAFTLAELLVSMAIVALLTALSAAGLGQMRSLSQGAHCANSLRQLGAATTLYLTDHQQKCFPYFQLTPAGKLWYFGFESSASLGQPEGQRVVDVTQSPLYPYMLSVGGIEICPAFPYNCLAEWKPKFRGASWGYGFNTFLSGASILTLPHPAQTLLFGDCAQVNTFQAPASPRHPMLEEFYMIENSYKTVHFRHAGQANILFLDGHVEKFSLCPGTQDMNLPAANVGRITPIGSTAYLQ